jgi:hypothetical protein
MVHLCWAASWRNAGGIKAQTEYPEFILPKLGQTWGASKNVVKVAYKFESFWLAPHPRFEFNETKSNPGQKLTAGFEDDSGNREASAIFAYFRENRRGIAKSRF